MNEKDYKAIAKIISHREYGNWSRANALADYFEKEGNISHYNKYTQGQETIIGFNRKQFLKDCGVE